MNYSKLAELHTNIWWQHDAKQFKQLEKTIYNFLSLLSFSPSQSKKASICICESYQEYDKTNFKKMKQKHEKAMKELGFSSVNGKNYADWWIAFSQRNKIKIIRTVWAYHYNFFKGINKVLAPKATLLLILAGLLGHNKRNKKITKIFLSLYWRVILIQGKRKFIIY